MNGTDRARLIDQRALASLRDEIRIRQTMDRSSWISVHSHHYFDLREEQWRELDSAASRCWSGSVQSRAIRVKIVILVESKSLKEKHLLLSPINPLRQAIISDWLGSQRRHQERSALYARLGLDATIAQRIDCEAFPGSADSVYLLRPPDQVDWHASGFAELQNRSNGRGNKQGKDLGSSIVWRARLGLQSASQALAKAELDSARGELTLAVQFALLNQMSATSKKLDLKAEVMGYLKKWPATITVFHPMVVVDADIWGVSLEKVVPVEHARIHLTDISRNPYFWFDLVKRDAVDQVLSRTQTEYDLQAAERGLTPAEQNFGVADFTLACP